MNRIKKILLLSLALMPVLGMATLYQYDPNFRLVTLQTTYPGGVEGLYGFCTSKLTEKLNNLQDVGVVLSDDDLKQETYSFLASCIYGKSDYELSRCAQGGSNCETVVLPVDLPTLKQVSGAGKVSTPTPVQSLAATLY